MFFVNSFAYSFGDAPGTPALRDPQCTKVLKATESVQNERAVND